MNTKQKIVATIYFPIVIALPFYAWSKGLAILVLLGVIVASIVAFILLIFFRDHKI